MRFRPLGAVELPRGAGAGTQQRRNRQRRKQQRCGAARRSERRSAPRRMNDAPLIRHLGLAPYEPTWRAMQSFTDLRDSSTPDEIWFVEHPPVFTLVLNASREHLLSPGDIPVVQIDRGGQVTYHGPGQLMIYPLLNLRRLKLGPRDLVVALENAVVAYAGELGLSA